MKNNNRVNIILMTAIALASSIPIAIANHSNQSSSVIEENQSINPVKEPQGISSQTEIQLKKISPAIKTISIESQGIRVEEKVLDNLQAIVTEIIENARLGMVRIPVTQAPTITPDIKLYENTKIMISVAVPSQESQAYQVNITLQEVGTQKAQIQVFDYDPKNWKHFYTNMKVYLTMQLNLQH